MSSLATGSQERFFRSPSFFTAAAVIVQAHFFWGLLESTKTEVPVRVHDLFPVA